MTPDPVAFSKGFVLFFILECQCFFESFNERKWVSLFVYFYDYSFSRFLRRCHRITCCYSCYAVGPKNVTRVMILIIDLDLMELTVLVTPTGEASFLSETFHSCCHGDKFDVLNVS